MLLIKDNICVAGGDVCEDAVAWGDAYLFAMDGASGLTGTHLMEAGSDAAWFSTGVRDGLCRLLDGGDRRGTAALLEEVLRELRREYEGRAAALGVPIPPDSPSAGLAMFREVGDEVEFFGLGDCVGVVELTDGSFSCHCDGSLIALDNGVLRQAAEIRRATGVSLLEARKQCSKQLLENRLLRNKPGGYWILEPAGEGLPHAQVRRWKREQVRRVSAFSDGFAQLTETFGLYPNYKALHQRMIRTPLRAMVEQLFRAQEADPDGNRHPRLKFRDDVCALWAEVKG